jgi:hypothetical protein
MTHECATSHHCKHVCAIASLRHVVPCHALHAAPALLPLAAPAEALLALALALVAVALAIVVATQVEIESDSSHLSFKR